jgi:hypothetical protein
MMLRRYVREAEEATCLVWWTVDGKRRCGVSFYVVELGRIGWESVSGFRVH